MIVFFLRRSICRGENRLHSALDDHLQPKLRFATSSGAYDLKSRTCW